MKIKIDCHLHTTRYSPCSSLSPVQACELAIKRGLNALVITEHQIQWTPQEVRELQAMFPGLKIFSGLEITLAEGFDIVVISDRQNLQVPLGISLNDLNKIMVRDTSFSFLAHAFRWTDIISRELLSVCRFVQGIELNSINILYQQYHMEKSKFIPDKKKLYDALQQRFSLVPLYNSDAHHEHCVGSISNCLELPAMPRDEAELARALASAAPCEVQNPKLLNLMTL